MWAWIIKQLVLFPSFLLALLFYALPVQLVANWHHRGFILVRSNMSAEKQWWTIMLEGQCLSIRSSKCWMLNANGRTAVPIKTFHYLKTRRQLVSSHQIQSHWIVQSPCVFNTSSYFRESYCYQIRFTSNEPCTESLIQMNLHLPEINDVEAEYVAVPGPRNVNVHWFDPASVIVPNHLFLERMRMKLFFHEAQTVDLLM